MNGEAGDSEQGYEAGQDGDEVLNATASLALIDTELRRTRRQVRTNPTVLFSVWGGAWLIGFGAAYLAHGEGRTIPRWMGIAVPVALLAGALVWSIGYAVRTDRGISGPSRTVAAMYGWSWTLGFACLFAVNGGLIRHGLSTDEAALLWSSTALLLTGMMYLAGGMLWRDPFQYTLGVWSMLCAAGAVFAGVPGNFLVQALAGGGGFLALAAYHQLRVRRGGSALRRENA